MNKNQLIELILDNVAESCDPFAFLQSVLENYMSDEQLQSFIEDQGFEEE
jgi:hypothetical protein